MMEAGFNRPSTTPNPDADEWASLDSLRENAQARAQAENQNAAEIINQIGSLSEEAKKQEIQNFVDRNNQKANEEIQKIDAYSDKLESMQNRGSAEDYDVFDNPTNDIRRGYLNDLSNQTNETGRENSTNPEVRAKDNQDSIYFLSDVYPRTKVEGENRSETNQEYGARIKKMNDISVIAQNMPRQENETREEYEKRINEAYEEYHRNPNESLKKFEARFNEGSIIKEKEGLATIVEILPKYEGETKEKYEERIKEVYNSIPRQKNIIPGQNGQENKVEYEELDQYKQRIKEAYDNGSILGSIAEKSIDKNSPIYQALQNDLGDINDAEKFWARSWWHSDNKDREKYQSAKAKADHYRVEALNKALQAQVELNREADQRESMKALKERLLAKKAAKINVTTSDLEADNGDNNAVESESDTPEASDNSDISDISDASDTPEVLDSSDTPESQEASDEHEVDDDGADRKKYEDFFDMFNSVIVDKSKDPETGNGAQDEIGESTPEDNGLISDESDSIAEEGESDQAEQEKLTLKARFDKVMQLISAVIFQKKRAAEAAGAGTSFENTDEDVEDEEGDSWYSADYDDSGFELGQEQGSDSGSAAPESESAQEPAQESAPAPAAENAPDIDQAFSENEDNLDLETLKKIKKFYDEDTEFKHILAMEPGTDDERIGQWFYALPPDKRFPILMEIKKLPKNNRYGGRALQDWLEKNVPGESNPLAF